MGFDRINLYGQILSGRILSKDSGEKINGSVRDFEVDCTKTFYTAISQVRDRRSFYGYW